LSTLVSGVRTRGLAPNAPQGAILGRLLRMHIDGRSPEGASRNCQGRAPAQGPPSLENQPPSLSELATPPLRDPGGIYRTVARPSRGLLARNLLIFRTSL
jgi:hypothetical protein